MVFVKTYNFFKFVNTKCGNFYLFIVRECSHTLLLIKKIKTFGKFWQWKIDYQILTLNIGYYSTIAFVERRSILAQYLC